MKNKVDSAILMANADPLGEFPEMKKWTFILILILILFWKFNKYKIIILFKKSSIIKFKIIIKA